MSCYATVTCYPPEDDAPLDEWSDYYAQLENARDEVEEELKTASRRLDELNAAD